MDFAVLAENRVKLKESEKNDKYLDRDRELEKVWNMKAMIIPILTSDLSIVTKGLVKGWENLEITGQKETIQTTV